jgi:two-component system cell cycle response regulator
LTNEEQLCRTILVADDDLLVRRLIHKSLETWGYKVIAVESGQEAWNILQQKDPVIDLVIVDWMMPGIDGVDLCRRIRHQHGKPYQYVLLISGKDEKENVVNGLDAGADDYLTKPFDIGELRARLRAGLRLLSLQQNLVQAREELRYHATHDALTGIWSRGAILELLGKELQRAARTGTPTGLLMIDLDHFKQINDQYGHLAGDAALKEVAGRVTNCLRSYDFVGRYGGEEFVALLSNCSEKDLSRIAERIRVDVGTVPVITHPQNITVTASIGGCITWNRATSDIELLSTADAALYKAKRTGRDRVVIACCESETKTAPASLNLP